MLQLRLQMTEILQVQRLLENSIHQELEVGPNLRVAAASKFSM